ncbi:MAG: hypothetical protein RLY40_862 [Pseudomonadota bacterium]|jgi:histidinol-phosphate/aromatic aminotransferase/cobyric acid decarboxylase-like protein
MKSSLIAEDKMLILRKLKQAAGSHSPSRAEMLSAFGEDPVKVDACFLSNPYATELVRDRFSRALADSSIDELIEAYPPGQELLLNWMALLEGIDPENSIVCNGAVQSIEWLMGELEYETVMLPYPTFSTYYEALPKGRKLIRYDLDEHKDFSLDASDIISRCKKESVDLLVLINPNNPTGQAISIESIEEIASELGNTKIIIDESFIHFCRDYEIWRKWRRNAIHRFPRLFFIKSLSKDYGMAGFRVGYIEGAGKEVRDLKSRYGTWNINNFAALCLREISKPDFYQAYEQARLRYQKDMSDFTAAVNCIKTLRAYPTDANFILVKLLDCNDGFSIVARMLIEHGIYVRTMEDKIGLDHTFLRIAGRTPEENEKIIAAISACTA